MALLACFAVAIGRGTTYTSTKVTAFSFATLGTGSKAAWRYVAASPPAPCSAGTTGGPAAFFRRNFRTSSTCSASITSLQQSAVATEELEKTMDVTHPAYDVIAKDVVSEYGAYTTLYKHKKSGAELLSVASDDDNKVSRNVWHVKRERKSSEIQQYSLYFQLCSIANIYR